LAGKRRLLILGPSFRRRRDESPLPALERFDGLFFRVARKHLSNAKDVDVLVMTDDLTLVDATTPLAYREPVGTKWGGQRPPKEALERAKAVNERILEEKLKSGQYSEVFLAMGKEYAKALPDLARFGVKTVFPTSRGPGPKAQVLRQWILKEVR
jgi:hypothetical protein